MPRLSLSSRKPTTKQVEYIEKLYVDLGEPYYSNRHKALKSRFNISFFGDLHFHEASELIEELKQKRDELRKSVS